MPGKRSGHSGSKSRSRKKRRKRSVNRDNESDSSSSDSTDSFSQQQSPEKTDRSKEKTTADALSEKDQARDIVVTRGDANINVSKKLAMT